jgi:ribonucleoside-diphosphate reductase alpha chain
MSALPTLYQQMIHISRYSRWIPEENRRETWEETVKRYFDFFQKHLLDTCDFHLNKDLRKELESAVLNLEIMPSMRCLMTAGAALEKDAVAGYNCSFLAVDTPRAFDIAMYLSMCGVGVGFSVERQYVSLLPTIPDELYTTDTTIVVEDSKIGWSKAFKELVGMLYIGQIPKWDLSKIRPAGTPLRTFGGRSAGSEPLNKLFKFVVNVFKNAPGRKLQSIECHDIMCMVGEIVVSGGKRRSALISLSNVSDDRMREAKSGQWWLENSQRALANNSACFTEKPDMGIFFKEWYSLYTSRSGERGIFNLQGAKKHIKENVERRDSSLILGTNPCGEVLLRNHEFCNLSEVVIRATDKKDDIKRKIQLATILGTFQSTLTDFRYIQKDWKKNCEEERLLGVSLTGIMDNNLTNKPSTDLQTFLVELKQLVIATNEKFATKLKIDAAAACTAIKPSGTVSSLVNSSSGIHARHSKYYIRSIRMDNKDPVCKLLKDANIPNEPDCMNDSTTVFFFPMKIPNESILRNDLTAIQQLELYLIYKNFYTEHTVSITINVKESEWLEVGAFVYKHFNDINGVSFLPYSDSCYKQSPYQECTKEEYEEAVVKMPKVVDWTKLKEYETQDSTTASKELACSGSSCELI